MDKDRRQKDGLDLDTSCTCLEGLFATRELQKSSLESHRKLKVGLRLVAIEQKRMVSDCLMAQTLGCYEVAFAWSPRRESADMGGNPVGTHMERSLTVAKLVEGLAFAEEEKT